MSSNNLALLLLLILLVAVVQLGCFDALVSGDRRLVHYNIHPRDSGEVVRVLGGSGLPIKGTPEYYSVWAARDRHRHRHAFTFQDGADTERINTLGSLHYGRISVGSPGVQFMVALDTGSDLFWLPCRCNNCPRSFNFSTDQVIGLNTYEPTSSSTSQVVQCNSPYCFGNSRRSCPLVGPTPCTYEYTYMSPNTATKGFLVEDLVHLETYDDANAATHIVAPMVFGCGEVETGFLLGGAAINGFLGLGHGTLDITSLLSSRGLVPNSFSLCFAPDGSGRIVFGDKGDADQVETPLLEGSHKSVWYMIGIERIYVENVATNIEFEAIFDSGSTITTLSEPTYTMLTKIFNVFMKDPRIEVANSPFEYCYIRESNNTLFWTPSLRLNTKGGGTFNVMGPIVTIDSKNLYGQTQVYCLGVINNTMNTVNIIGHNFMAGYRVVFDREKLILGWKSSDCKTKEANTSNASMLSIQNGRNIIFLLSFFFIIVI